MAADRNRSSTFGEVELDSSSVLIKPKGWQARYTLTALGFFGFAMTYALRFNISLVMTAMVKDKKKEDNSTYLFKACQGYESTNLGRMVEVHGQLDWDESEQHLILNSFFYGYVATQFIGGVISNQYGGKWPFGIGLFVTAVFALLTPMSARIHKYCLICVRIIQGLSEGLIYPAMHSILAVWIPPVERTGLGTISYGGAYFGIAFTIIVSGNLVDAQFLGGWPSVFYVLGMLTIIWFVLWCIFVHDHPDKHPTISPEELIYLKKSIGSVVSTSIFKIPWRDILKSLPFWAIIIAQTGHTYGLYSLLNNVPKYMKTVLQFEVLKNRWISTITYLLMWIFSLFTGEVVDFLIARNRETTGKVRKVCQCVGVIGPAILLFGASGAGCNRALAVTLFTLTRAINGVVDGGFLVNHIDIGSNYAGILMGIANTFDIVPGIIGPKINDPLLRDDSSLTGWLIVFGMTATVYVTSGIFYAVFASGKEQPWNQHENQLKLKVSQSESTTLKADQKQRNTNNLLNNKHNTVIK